MFDARERLRRLRRRLRRIERREQSALRRWIEDTDNLIHASVLLFVPLTIAGVTALANSIPSLSFLLFPPLASGAYTLFADPEGRYASPIRFVAGLTIGSVCGWIALVTLGSPGSGDVNAWAAMLAVLLTGTATWALDVEEPSGYSAALLLLVQEAPPTLYVLSVAVASTIVAVVYVTWHDTIYERRAEFLYATTGRDDDVLVPMLDGSDSIARLGARIASGHEQGRLVLLGFANGPEERTGGGEVPSPNAKGGSTSGDVDQSSAADASEAEDGIDPAVDVSGAVDETDPAVDASGAEDGTDGGVGDRADESRAGDDPEPSRAASQASAEHAIVERLEAQADELREATGANCEVVVARGSDPATVTRETARETGCDLILAPFHGPDEDGFVTSLFASELDVAAARVERQRWLQVLVPIRSAGDLAHRKVDLARRIAGPAGRVTVAHCIDSEKERRKAEAMCANVVDAYDGRFETLVARADVEAFLGDHAPANDLIVLGASTDRSPVSRMLSPPTYERVHTVDTDLLVVHAGRP
ncbi:HPP family protein [Salinarchaeum chitinilyticum]